MVSIFYSTLKEKHLDEDGIPNHLDLDSDNDGCYDSYEANVIGSTNDGSIRDSLAATTSAQVGSNGFADALEMTAVGMYDGTYTYHQALDSISVCDQEVIVTELVEYICAGDSLFFNEAYVKTSGGLQIIQIYLLALKLHQEVILLQRLDFVQL